MDSPRALAPDELVLAVVAAREQLAGRLPEIDPGDLLLILQSLLRPVGTGRRFFLRRLGPDLLVP